MRGYTGIGRLSRTAVAYIGYSSTSTITDI